MNNGIKLFLMKSIIFVACVFLAQVLIGHYVTPEPEVVKLEGYLRDKVRIIYFGASDVLTYAEGDTDHAYLPQMLADKNPGYTVGNMGHPAYSIEVFEAAMDYISRSPLKPEAVVVPIQLRAFSPEWDMRPVNQFEKVRFFMTHSAWTSYFYKPLAILRAIETNSVSYNEFLNTPVYYGSKQVGVASDFEAVDKRKPPTDENIRGDYIYKYMYALDLNHRKLQSLARLLDTASKAGIKVYTYITPIDYEVGAKYVGKDFISQTKENAAKVCVFLKDHAAPCLDLSHSVGSKDFDHPAYPTEHLNDKGRELVARKISELYLRPQTD